MASLELRTGLLGKRLASHLIKRTSYNYTATTIDFYAEMTASQAVDTLFVVPDLVHPEGPINYVDGITPWLTSGPFENNPANGTKQRRSVQLWLYNEMLHDTSIRHKMVLFFHSIFITGNDSDWRYFDLFRLFQQYATGNIRTLAYKATLDSKMLRYLNNNVNSKNSPNENYAREFMELFTILKGEQIAPGNYTNYTEYDIQQAARVLTGFKDTNFDNKDPETGLATGYANYNNHDKGNKTFSANFQLQTILGAVDETDMYRELNDFIDMIFNQTATASSFARRLYRYFVSDRINTEIETDIIAPIAAQLLNDGYELSTSLKMLLKSKHFYDEDDSTLHDEIIGGKIKSPLELYFGGINFFEANQMGSLTTNPDHYNGTANQFIHKNLAAMGFPDAALSVEGYPGFYKAPNYSKYWVDQATIPYRFRLAYGLLNGKSVLGSGSMPFEVDMVSFTEQNIQNPGYSDQLVEQLLEYCLPYPPDSDRFEYFQNKLLDSLSPVNWYFEWYSYSQSGEDSAVRIALNHLFESIITSPEFQTF